jgi:DNA polymerase-3 subunit chi
VIQVGFYHCTRSRPLDVLPQLAAKALDAGHRVLIHAADDQTLDAADKELWTFEPASFLPHGRDNPAAQPVLLSDDFQPVNGADVGICIGGRMPGEPQRFSRLLYLFDGSDEAAVRQARAHWKAIAALEGVEPAYWTQGDRGWSKAG